MLVYARVYFDTVVCVFEALPAAGGGIELFQFSPGVLVTGVLVESGIVCVSGITDMGGVSGIEVIGCLLSVSGTKFP